jgi:hypothetical protein
MKSAPNIGRCGEEFTQAGESVLHHHFEVDYAAPDPESGCRLARP